MSRNDVELIREIFESRINDDPRLDATWHNVTEWMHPQFEYREDPALPGADTYCGIDAFREACCEYYDALSEMRLEAEGYFDAGDSVLVVIRWWARGHSGIEAEMRQAGIFTVDGGRVASWQVYFDCDQAFRRVGLTR